MKLERVLDYAKTLLRKSIDFGDVAIDATAGNGHDTLYLTELVGDTGHVFAFDVQQQALDATADRLKKHGVFERTTLILDGHENIATYVAERIGGAIFNLGYLPGADHTVTTHGQTTIQAIDEMLEMMKIGGIIVLVVYHGHEGGKEERDDVLTYVESLSQKQVHVLRYDFLNQKNDPPFILALEKVKPYTKMNATEKQSVIQ